MTATSDDMFHQFSRNRALHCHGVATFMRDFAPAVDLNPVEAAIVGFNHDVGYLFTHGDNRTHNALGGGMLAYDGYVHAREIRLHGTPEGLSTPMGVLLNTGDMMVDAHGQRVGFKRRLEDIARRHGKSSAAYSDAQHMQYLIQGTREYAQLHEHARDNSLYWPNDDDDALTELPWVDELDDIEDRSLALLL